MKIHIVQKGDTLWKIAKKYGVNFEELKKMNSQLSNPDMIMPGMKVKVPTSGGMVKKENPVGQKPAGNVNLGFKKEMPIAEHPFAKEKPIPIVQAPIKEAPIIKEAPKAPYTPKMPIIPEIDINNYYMMNMANMTVKEAPQPQPQLPPQPVVKEAPKQEVPPPMPVCPPLPVEQPVCEPVLECAPECVPMTPVMPGTGFCPPFDPVMPYPHVAGAGMQFPPGCAPMPMAPGMNPAVAGAPMPMAPGMNPAAAGVPMSMAPGMNPAAAGPAYVPPYFEDESSSSFMPQMPPMNPSYIPGGGMGGPVPPAGVPVQPQYMHQGMAQMPQGYYPQGGYQGYPAADGYYPQGQGSYSAAGYTEIQGSYPAEGYPGFLPGYPVAAYPTTYAVPSPGYPTGPYGVRDTPNETWENNPGYPPPEYVDPRTGYVNYAVPHVYGTQGSVPFYGQMPYGYPPQGSSASNERGTYEASMPPAGMLQYPGQDGGQLPVGTGSLGDCGCVAPQVPAPNNFIPTTPPVFMAPYTAPANIAQPPFMNPYGMGPMGSSQYGMPGDDDESDENGR